MIWLPTASAVLCRVDPEVAGAAAAAAVPPVVAPVEVLPVVDACG